jgi:hypothetical protein
LYCGDGLVTGRLSGLGQGILEAMTTPLAPFWSWDDWYRFARDVLGYRHEESNEYANRRHVESENRALLADQAQIAKTLASW